MNLCFPRFPQAALTVLIAAAGQQALAAGMPAASDPAVHLNSVGVRNSFNSLSREDRRDLLAAPESESSSQGGSRRQAMNRAQRCEGLEQQLKGAAHREPIIAPDFYPYADLSRTYPGQPNREPNGARPNYAEPNGRDRGNTSLMDVFFASKDKESRSQRRDLEMRYADVCGK
jgi:hypothetical protein